MLCSFTMVYALQEKKLQQKKGIQESRYLEGKGVMGIGDSQRAFGLVVSMRLRALQQVVQERWRWRRMNGGGGVQATFSIGAVVKVG